MKRHNEYLDTMHRDPGNWKGVFYFNRKDPRLSVPKLSGLGWTLNFASPYSWLLIIAVALIIILSQYFL